MSFSAIDAKQIDAYRAILDSTPEPPSGLTGEGVIYALYENNSKANVGTEIAIRLLREVGWKGIIQLWHVGNHPNVSAYGVDLIDAREVQRKHGGEIRSWTIKSFAIAHSGLARAQWCDWDCYAAANPQPLFDALDEHEMIFWAANGGWDWNQEIHGAVHGGPFAGGGFQGGSYLLDCRRGAKLLALQRHYDDNRAWWYSRNRNDEGGWELGIAALKSRGECNALWSTPMTWRHPAWINHYAGKPYMVHRCSGKFWGGKSIPRNNSLPMEARAFELFGQLTGERVIQAYPTRHRHFTRRHHAQTTQAATAAR